MVFVLSVINLLGKYSYSFNVLWLLSEIHFNQAKNTCWNLKADPSSFNITTRHLKTGYSICVIAVLVFFTFLKCSWFSILFDIMRGKCSGPACLFGFLISVFESRCHQIFFFGLGSDECHSWGFCPPYPFLDAVS